MIDETVVEDYHKYTVRKLAFITFSATGLFILFGLSLTVGTRDIGFFEVYQMIWDHLHGATYEYHSELWWDDYIVWNTRLPRAIVAIVAGAGLAIGGAAMQSIMKNPLADPYTTGISSAAVFGVTLAIIMGFSAVEMSDQAAVVFNAFVFGMLPVGAILVISRYSSTTPATLILAGVAISYFFSALSNTVMDIGSNEELAMAYLWQIGTVEGMMWEDIPLMLTVVLIGSIIMQLVSKQLNVLSLGDDSAKSLGLDAANFRILMLALMSLVTASVISFTGIIGFLGLVVPHLVRLVLGSDNKYVLPAAMIVGSLLLLGADTLGKGLVDDGSLPVGVVMSFIGAPIFLYLIVRQKKDAW